MNRRLPLLLPVAASAAALAYGGVGWKVCVPLSCMAVLLVWGTGLGTFDRWLCAAAFLAAAAGDYFLAVASRHPGYFELGILCFLVAHLALIGYALGHGSVHRLALGCLLAAFLPYYFLGILPHLSDGLLRAAVLGYLLVSCLGFAAAMGFRAPPPAPALYRAGLAMLLVSDTLISLGRFLGIRAGDRAVLPIYYLFLILVTASLLCLRPPFPRSPQEPGGPSARTD